MHIICKVSWAKPSVNVAQILDMNLLPETLVPNTGYILFSRTADETFFRKGAPTLQAKLTECQIIIQHFIKS